MAHANVFRSGQMGLSVHHRYIFFVSDVQADAKNVVFSLRAHNRAGGVLKLLATAYHRNDRPEAERCHVH